MRRSLSPFTPAPQARCWPRPCAASPAAPRSSISQTARALDKGQFEATQAPSVIGQTDNGVLAKSAGPQPAIYVAGRYGVAEGFDVGFKFEPVVGFIATATVQLLRSHWVDLALAPSTGYFQMPGPLAYGTNLSVEEQSLRPTYSVIPIDLPLLVGINLGNDHQLVIGPRLSAFLSLPVAVYEPANGSPTATTGGVELFAGGGLGVSFKAGARLRVMPEVDVMKPIAWTGAGTSTCGTDSCAPYPTSAVIYQFSVGIAMGLLGPAGFL